MPLQKKLEVRHSRSSSKTLLTRISNLNWHFDPKNSTWEPGMALQNANHILFHHGGIGRSASFSKDEQKSSAPFRKNIEN